MLKRPAGRQGWLLIMTVAVLLLAVSIFESLRYFKPVTAFKTGRAQRTESLPDGSRVQLNKQSRLTLSDEWTSDENREAWMEGEGYFTTVATGDTNGVTIHTPRFDVVSTGARFNIYNRNNTIRAWLEDGEAYILTHDSKPKKVPFTPGDLVEYRNKQFTTHKEPAEKVTAWRALP